jgi:fumarate reductase subunit C
MNVNTIKQTKQRISRKITFTFWGTLLFYEFFFKREGTASELLGFDLSMSVGHKKCHAT